MQQRDVHPHVQAFDGDLHTVAGVDVPITPKRTLHADWPSGNTAYLGYTFTP